MNIKRMKLSKEEKAIEAALLRGEYVDVGPAEMEDIRQAIARKRKEAVLHLRINQQDLDILKKKARDMGVKYQTFIAEILHRFAA